MREAFILGSGFSRAINEEMPTLSHLSEEILPAIRDRDPRLARRLLRMGHNVELWMAYLSQSQPWLSMEHNQQNFSVAALVRRVLCSIINDRVRETRSLPEWLHQIVGAWHARQATIITLNYDTLIERAARDPSVLAGVEETEERGLLPSHLYPPYFAYVGGRDGYGAWAPTPVDTFTLLKLHGSTNWHYSGQPDFHGETILWTDTAMIGSASQQLVEEAHLAEVSDKQPLIIPPVSEKTTYFQNETVNRLWWEAARVLRQADKVFVIGYSLPLSDLGMRAFLATTLHAPSTEVFIVDPCADVAQRFRDLLGSSRVIDRFVSARDPVAQFAAAYVDNDL